MEDSGCGQSRFFTSVFEKVPSLGPFTGKGGDLGGREGGNMLSTIKWRRHVEVLSVAGRAGL